MSNEASVIYTPTQYEGFNDKPVLASMQTKVEGTSNGVMIVKKSVACRIAVSDQRAFRFLIDATAQLPSSGTNLIWIDGNHVPSIKIWPKLILKQFTGKPELNKTVSGLITFTGSIGLNENMISPLNSVTLTQNEFAEHKVPNWVIDKITAANKS